MTGPVAPSTSRSNTQDAYTKNSESDDENSDKISTPGSLRPRKKVRLTTTRSSDERENSVLIVYRLNLLCSP
jgi:hypothetical protein